MPPRLPSPPLPQGLRTALFAVAVLLAGPASAPAQVLPSQEGLEQEWRWVDFGAESGLPAGVPRAVVEVDSLVWTYTDHAAAWYDGFQWHPAEAAGVPLEGPVSSLAADSARRILLVQGGRIYRGGIGGFEELPRPGPLADRALRRALPFAGERLLVTTEGPDPRVWVVDGIDARALSDSARVFDADHVWLTRAGHLWAATHRGLATWRDGAWQVRDPVRRDPREGAMVVEGRSGLGFAYLTGGDAEERGVYLFRGDGPLRRVVREGDALLASADVGDDEVILAAYLTGDVRAYENGRWRAIELPGPRGNGVQMVHIGRNGDLWFGTSRGLHLFRTERNRFSVLRRPFPDPMSRVNAILVDADTSVWLATAAGVLHRRPRAGGDVDEWHVRARGVPLHLVTSLALDTRGRVWATSGSAFEGVMRWDGSRWSHLGPGQGMDVGSVHSVSADPDGSVWLSSLGRQDGRGAGLYRWSPEGVDAVSRRLGIPDTRTYAMARRGDSLWIATLDGLYRVVGDQATLLRSDPLGEGVPARLWDVAVAADGTPWIAYQPTLSAGLARVEGDSLVHVVPPGPEGVRRVWSLLFDRDGALWVGTEGGVLRFADGVWASIDASVGLPTLNVWPLAEHPTALLIGTKGGGMISLSQAEMDNPPPRVVVHSQILEGRTVRVDFSALPYWGEMQPGLVETRHRVDGGPWSPWSVDRHLLVSNLESGPHTVELQAKGLFGKLSEPVPVAANVPFPLPLRPAFAVPVGVLLAALLLTGAAAARRRRRDEEALRLSEGRLRALVEGSYEAIGLLDLEQNRFIDANENASRLFGLPREALLSSNLISLSPTVLPSGRTAREHLAQLTTLAVGGDPQLVEWTVLDTEGHGIPCEMQLSLLPSAGGTLLRVSLLDIRDRQAAEARRRELEEQLRQSQKLEAVGQLTGGVAHDFNNLLTVIRGNLEMLDESVALDEDARTLLDEATQAAERSSKLTERLLAFSRRQTLAPTPLHLRDIVGELHDLLTRSLGEAVLVSFEIPSNAWTVNVDRGQFESAILNLCLNSRDAMPQGGSIRIGAENVLFEELDPSLRENLDPGDYVRLYVADTGTGMPPEVQARAFDPFFTTKEVGKGTGLGLSMVYGFVSQSGGTVHIESVRGQGTSVNLYLPREATLSDHEDGGDGGRSVPKGRGEVVLMVEDDPGLTRLLGQFLQRLGYTALSAPDGPRALRVIRGRDRIDVLLTDLVLPAGLSGVQVAAEARAIHPSLPVLFMSGYSEETIPPEARPPRGAEILRKPFDLPTLGRKLRTALDS